MISLLSFYTINLLTIKNAKFGKNQSREVDLAGTRSKSNTTINSNINWQEYTV